MWICRFYAAASNEAQDDVLRRMMDRMGRLNHKIDRSLDLGLGTATVDFMAQMVPANRSGELRESLKSGILEKVFETERDAESMVPRTFSIDSSKRRPLKQKVLRNLAYPGMHAREASVVRASETTFRWIFEPEKRPDRPWANFCEWLEAPDKQLYWITGKPGSGKSTLMKYISESEDDEHTTGSGKPDNLPRCSSFLQKWAGSCPLVVASYYFWALGSPMQRSKEGMLRTLLYGLLSHADSEAIAAIMPENWEALHLFDDDPRPFTESSLQIFLSRAFHYMCRSMKICLFIDGLDEFEGQHDDLILYLSGALENYPIKLCVTSRQWQVFEDAFHSKPSLRLQDLTFPDMVGYVQSKLYIGPAFLEFQSLYPTFSEKLDENVALRADGVFLWLVLVVESLRRGIVAGDRVSDLHVRLDQLPQDLEALFDRILGGLDPEYLDHAIQYFKLMEACREMGPPNVMVFSFADEDDEIFGLTCPVTPLDKKTYENRRDQLKRRLNSRCMGLIEITEQAPSGEGLFFDASQSRVHYLHRTVWDYMARDEVREKLSRRAGQGLQQSFDPHLRLCSSELAFRKSNPLAVPSATNRLRSSTHYSISHTSLLNCLRHAAKVQKSGLESMIRIVDAVRSVPPTEEDERFDKYTQEYEFCSSGPSQVQDTLSFLIYDRSPFISLVIRCGIMEYVRAKTQQWSPRRTASLWHKALRTIRKHRTPDAWSDFDWQLSHAVLSPSTSSAIVALLLERGADFRYIDPVECTSIWELALMIYMYFWQDDSQDKEKREHIMALMIKYGAPINYKTIVHSHRGMCSRLTSRTMMRKDKQVTFCDKIQNKLRIIKRELEE